MNVFKRSVVSSVLLAGAIGAQAKVIVVTTTDNVSPGTNQTNLVQAIKLLADGDTIQFNIPGSGVQYIQTPTDGYPLITANSVTIDGYSQPGAVPNSNPLHAPNNAVLKIALTSTNGNGLSMQTAITNFTGVANGNLGFGPDELAILGFYQGSNITVRGLAFLSAPQVSGSGFTGDMKTISFCPDVGGQCDNWHVSGCWFGVDPVTRQTAYMSDNTTVAMPAICIAAYRSRDPSGNNPTYAQPGTIGVSAGSANPHAEFNVFVTGYGFDSEGLNYRISGNFWNVLPDGMTNLDPSQANSGSQQGDGYIEVGRVSDNLVIGTDGDGVNDADEGNLFGGVNSSDWANLYLWSSDATNVVIAGNWYGVAIDGQTRFTNTSVIVHGIPGTAQLQFGSDLDGKSDDLEGNVVFNNNPFAVLFPNPASGSSLEPGFFPKVSAGARVSMRGNKLVNNNLVPFSYADGLSDLLMNFTNYEAPYMDTTTDVIPNLTNGIYPKLGGTFAKGIDPYTNITIDVYQLDPEGWQNGIQFALAEMTDSSTFTNGFPQGSKYLKSFSVPNSGAFNLDLSGLDLGAGPVTVTVNYSADPPGTHAGRNHTGNFSTPGYLFPALADSVGLTHVAPDVACWYDNVGGPGGNGFVTNGFINLAQQPSLVQLGNWEPYTAVLGDSTFLVTFGTYANDGSLANQNFCVAKQPAAGGQASIGYEFYADDGTPFMGAINLSRQNGNPPRIAGDMRYGAAKFVTEAEVSIGQISAFQTVSRWGNNDIYQGTDRYAAEQLFNINPLTLAQTPVTNAWDYVYGGFSGMMGTGNNAPQCSRTGGRPNFLDNGNIVVMIDDKTAISSTTGEVTTFAIIDPQGNIVKGPTLVDPNAIWDNMCAYRGGFAIRVHNLMYFFDNAGNLQHTTDVVITSGLGFTTDRGDATRIGSDIRSSYVYLAGAIGSPVWVAIFDSRTGNFVAKAQVTDGNPTSFKTDRVMVAVDALDRFCVVFPYQPTADFPFQIAARVMAFDGTNVSYLTHSFYPFVNAISDAATATASGLSFSGGDPSVAMTTREICIAAKGTINSTNNPTAGADSQPQQTVYTVISHPAPVAAPQPDMTITHSGGNTTITWPQDAGLFVLQSAASLSSPISWNDVSPQPAIVGPANGKYSMTLPSSGANSFFRLVRRW